MMSNASMVYVHQTTSVSRRKKMPLKDFKYNAEEDGDVPPLVTGDEDDLESILSNVKADGGLNLVSEKKIMMANKQFTEEKESRQKIPVTVITGYLGSGKSTLLERIVLKGSELKIAVILNEFGDSSEIEKSMTIRNNGKSYEEWLDLGNGCLCCSLKDVGVKAIEAMVARSPGKIDYILLETSGIADPAPIARMFWQDEGLSSNIYIDGIVTVLDSEHILSCLDDVTGDSHWHGEKVVLDDGITVAHLQIAMADTILLNKIDKLEKSEMAVAQVEDRVQGINALAPIYHTKYGNISLDKILNLHAFTVSNILETHGTFHDPRISTVTLSCRPLKNYEEFQVIEEQFLQLLLWRDFGRDEDGTEIGLEVHRTKALIIVGTDVKIVQGVRNTYDILPGDLLPNVEECKFVFIGKYLDAEHLQTKLEKALKNHDSSTK
ncbi:GTP-dependent zinc transferase Ecym_2495 [Eremothecium cymbalariae DBVPG|uniref:CobW/HypB/UreG nucleotide-binding domain-containing protein n=1 Tax=Eremothecium cymbalariae (strain CBS 270.75 / DBVPG 7215 / KCTC 17166 / NRRL Y-17582) TaxID=931890 RepID=G8JPV9_ERECY|nr:Hypothetical protein Ecym_2495 [Eremothecium cymbalariae DBVPG\